ncbi:MAG: SAM-dependent methyltransferase [Steroidobacteraceae bacterium]
MARRCRSSGRWLQEHLADPFVKLEEPDQREKLLRPGQACRDLGAAPGAWSQYATRRVGHKGRVVATDILPMDPSSGMDVRLSDRAPNLSGIDAVDQLRSMYLAELALDTCGWGLKPDGTALIKVFQGSGCTALLAHARQQFAKVRMLKPEASRARSPELYLLAKDFTIV